MSTFNIVSVFLLAFIAGRNVESQLISSYTNTACEGYTLNLACSPGYLINVMYSNYGRLVPGCFLCPKFLQDLYTLCFSSNATTTMRSRVLVQIREEIKKIIQIEEKKAVDSSVGQRNGLVVIKYSILVMDHPPYFSWFSTVCNDRNNCSVAASNSVFGNPCMRTYKYLLASYQCIKYERACEGNNLNITCPSGQKIMILNANYGRTLPGTEVCQYSNPNATTNTNCTSANSTQIVSSRCTGQVSCSVPATNTVFGGDPCPGTYKYLQATYYCA